MIVMSLKDILRGEDVETALQNVIDGFHFHPNFDLQETLGKETYREHLSHSIKIAEMGINDVDPDPETEFNAEYNYIHSIGDNPFYFQAPAWGEDAFLWGRLGVPIQNRHSDFMNAKEADPGAFLYELRRKHYDIVDRNATEYITPLFTNEQIDQYGSHQPEDILNLTVPPDYDEDVLDETVDAVDRICLEVDDLYRNLLVTVMEY